MIDEARDRVLRMQKKISLDPANKELKEHLAELELRMWMTADEMGEAYQELRKWLREARRARMKWWRLIAAWSFPLPKNIPTAASPSWI